MYTAPRKKKRCFYPEQIRPLEQGEWARVNPHLRVFSRWFLERVEGKSQSERNIHVRETPHIRHPHLGMSLARN